MGKLIDVDTAIRAAVEYIEDWNRAPSMYHRRKLTEKFMALKPVDAVPVRHGKWVDDSNGIEGAWNYCSVCGEQAIDLYDYCPNCGAKMDGKEDGNETD